ncbi:MAG: hypothetical protein HY754_03375 [Nitrospirae bacterium]|nr:hypothetical protein [Nitrospirota bacterium]
MISAEVTKTTVETSFFTPNVIVTLLSTAIASVIIPLTLYFLKAMKEKKDKLYQMRYEAYTQYFKKFESVSSDLGNDYEEFSKITLPEKFKKLLESDNSPDAILEFQSAVGSFPHKIQASYQKWNK